jgi:hypothetical protein
MENQPQPIPYSRRDLQKINGKSLSTCGRHMREIRKENNLKKHQYVTAKQIGLYFGISEQEVLIFKVQ